jgi:hypothetical protein
MGQPDVFPEPTTPRTRHLGHTEPRVRWLTESTRPEAVTARSNINAWYRRFDPSGTFGARLRTRTRELQHSPRRAVCSSPARQRHPDVAYESGNVGQARRRLPRHPERLPTHLIEVLSLNLREEDDLILA